MMARRLSTAVARWISRRTVAIAMVSLASLVHQLEKASVRTQQWLKDINFAEPTPTLRPAVQLRWRAVQIVDFRPL